jgi:hypothetical protein
MDGLASLAAAADLVELQSEREVKISSASPLKRKVFFHLNHSFLTEHRRHHLNLHLHQTIRRKRKKILKLLILQLSINHKYQRSTGLLPPASPSDRPPDPTAPPSLKDSH